MQQMQECAWKFWRFILNKHIVETIANSTGNDPVLFYGGALHVSEIAKDLRLHPQLRSCKKVYHMRRDSCTIVDEY